MKNKLTLSIVLAIAFGIFFGVHFSSADSANLVTNPGAEAGDSATGWTVTANGGSGWNMSTNWDGMIHSGSRVFRTSYGWDVMEQTVDLSAGGIDLGAKPDIVFSDWINSRCNGTYYITYKILDSGSNEIASYNFGTSGSPASVSGGNDITGWTEKTYTFSGYSTAARYAYIQQAGKDSCGWGGYYGPHFDDASVIVKTVVPAISGSPAFTAGTPAKSGTQLTVGAGTLNPATNLTYTWYRSTNNSYDGGDTSLGTGTTYTPVAGDIGKYLIVSASSTDATGTAALATQDKVINVGSSASTDTNSGNATLSAPDGFASDNVTLSIEKINSSPNSLPAGYLLVGDNHFQLTATNGSGDPVSSFDQAVTFTVSYGSSAETQYVESSLDVYRYENGGWAKKNCTLDTSANTLTCSLSSFSEYGVFGEEIAASPDDEEEDVEVKNVEYSAGNDSVTVKWETDIKADSNVRYGTKRSNLNLKEDDDKKEKDHKIVLKNLEPDTKYYFKVHSKNEDDNEDSSKIYSIKTSGNTSEENNFSEEKLISDYSGDAKPSTCSYTVESGDNLWTIAKKIYGDSTAYPLIIESNKEKYPEIADFKLSIGQELIFNNCDSGKVQGDSDVKAEKNTETPIQESDKDKKWWNPFGWF